jgi:small subunit ribosomal protein S15
MKNGAGTTDLSVAEIEEIVVKLAKEGITPSKIGMVLRDQYAVSDVKIAAGKSVAKILDAHGVKFEIPEDLTSVIKKAVKLYAHLDQNRKDNKSKRSLEVTESRINRLSRYYKRKGLIPKDWRYDRERAALLVR